MWKDAGRPRSGPIADLRNSDKRKYKREQERQCYTIDLHDALVSKSGTRFLEMLEVQVRQGKIY